MPDSHYPKRSHGARSGVATSSARLTSLSHCILLRAFRVAVVWTPAPILAPSCFPVLCSAATRILLRRRTSECDIRLSVTCLASSAMPTKSQSRELTIVIRYNQIRLAPKVSTGEEYNDLQKIRELPGYTNRVMSTVSFICSDVKAEVCIKYAGRRSYRFDPTTASLLSSMTFLPHYIDSGSAPPRTPSRWGREGVQCWG
jgi:hypothetical protein